MSLRRTRRESAQSASASPCEPASRTSSAQLTGGAPASLTLTPQGSGASKALPAAASRTQSTRSVRLSQDSTQAVANRTAAAVGGLIGPASGVACGDHGVPCTDEISELLLSEQDIMADPTAIQLFMELNEEIEAEGRAALEAAEAAAAATAVRPAAQARPDPVEAVVLSNAAVASYDTLACSTEAVMQLQPASRSDETQPVAVSDRGQAGQAYLQQQEQVQQMDGAAVKVSGHDQVRGSGCCQVQDNAAEMPTAAADPTSTTVEACAKSNAATEEAAVPVRACSTEATEHQSKKHEEQPEHQPSCGCQCVIM